MKHLIWDLEVTFQIYSTHINNPELTIVDKTKFIDTIGKQVSQSIPDLIKQHEQRSIAMKKYLTGASYDPISYKLRYAADEENIAQTMTAYVDVKDLIKRLMPIFIEHLQDSVVNAVSSGRQPFYKQAKDIVNNLKDIILELNLFMEDFIPDILQAINKTWDYLYVFDENANGDSCALTEDQPSNRAYSTLNSMGLGQYHHHRQLSNPKNLTDQDQNSPEKEQIRDLSKKLIETVAVIANVLQSKFRDHVELIITHIQYSIRSYMSGNSKITDTMLEKMADVNNPYLTSNLSNHICLILPEILNLIENRDLEKSIIKKGLNVLQAIIKYINVNIYQRRVIKALVDVNVYQTSKKNYEIADLACNILVDYIERQLGTDFNISCQWVTKELKNPTDSYQNLIHKMINNGKDWFSFSENCKQIELTTNNIEKLQELGRYRWEMDEDDDKLVSHYNDFEAELNGFGGCFEVFRAERCIIFVYFYIFKNTPPPINSSPPTATTPKTPPSGATSSSPATASHPKSTMPPTSPIKKTKSFKKTSFLPLFGAYGLTTTENYSTNYTIITAQQLKGIGKTKRE